MHLSDPERSTLAEIGKRLGRAALQQVACVAKPDTVLVWYRRLPKLQQATVEAKWIGGRLVQTTP
jgi:hypothetical protein